MNKPSPDQSALANAIAIAHTLLSIALQMALPPLLGYWLDQRWGTGSLLTILGAILGLVAGMYNLVRTARKFETAQRKDQPRDKE